MTIRVAWGKGRASALVAAGGPIVVIDALRMSATVIVALCPSCPHADLLETVSLDSRSGQRLIALGYEEDVRLCARVDRYPIIPTYQRGCLTV